MRVVMTQQGPGGLWMGPGLLGLVLILMGVAFLIWPQLAIYLLAFVLIAVGTGFVITAYAARRTVTYQRLDPSGMWGENDQRPV